MGRKVFVTSDISIDENLIIVAERDPLAALIWPWILTALDDWGRAEAKPRMLKAKVFPCNVMITIESIETALSLYHDVGLIELYEVANKPYLSVSPDKWFKYQTHIRKDKRNVDESKYPAPPIARVCAEMREVRMQKEPEYLQNEPSPSPSPSPLYTDDNDTCARESEKTDKPILGQVLDYAEKAWGRLIVHKEIEVITLAMNDLTTRGSKETKELICDAIDRCSGYNVRNAKYLDGIIRQWLDKGILSIDTLKRDDEAFGKKKERASPKGVKPNEKHPGDSEPWKDDPYMQAMFGPKPED